MIVVLTYPFMQLAHFRNARPSVLIGRASRVNRFLQTFFTSVVRLIQRQWKASAKHNSPLRTSKPVTYHTTSPLEHCKIETDDFRGGLPPSKGFKRCSRRHTCCCAQTARRTEVPSWLGTQTCRQGRCPATAYHSNSAKSENEQKCS